VRRESKEKLTQQKKKKKSTSATPFLIKKPEKGQETIGEVVSIGEKFVTVKSEKQTIRRIPQNLKKVGRLKKEKKEIDAILGLEPPKSVSEHR